MKVPNASGVDTRRITPCSDKLRCTAGSCKALLMAACPAGRKWHDEAEGIRRPGLAVAANCSTQRAAYPKDENRNSFQRLVHNVFSKIAQLDERVAWTYPAAFKPSISIAPALIRGMSSRPNSIVSLNGSKPRMRNESTPSR